MTLLHGGTKQSVKETEHHAKSTPVGTNLLLQLCYSLVTQRPISLDVVL